MASEICSDDSDSDSLPELSVLFPAPSNEISNGDIVWAKFKKLYWPALVRHVYRKERKVTVWYTDDPGKNFKLPMKNVFLFHDRDMTAKIKKEVSEHGISVVKAHEGLTTHALSYLNRKAEGKDDNPLKFFDQTYPYFTIEEWLAKNPTDNREMFNGIKINPLYLNHGAGTSTSTSIRKRGSNSEAVISDDSDIVPADEDSDEELSNTKRKSAGCGKSTDNTISVSAEFEYINQIVTCILSGKTDMYLSKVMSEKMTSVYYNFYLKAMKSDRRNLDYISYGPVEDLKQLRQIIFYLLDLYDGISRKGKTCKIKTDVCYSSGNKTDEARFVSSVLLPESIIFAISHVKKISLDEAKSLFHRKSDVKQEVGPLESVDESKETDTTDSNRRDENNEISNFDNFVIDVDAAGCSNRNTRLALADVLEDIDKHKCPKDFSSASSENYTDVTKNVKSPLKSGKESLKRGKRHTKSVILEAGLLESVDESKRNTTDSNKNVLSNIYTRSCEVQIHDHFLYDVDKAGCSKKRSYLALDDILEDNNKEKESCTVLPKIFRKPPKSVKRAKKPTESDKSPTNRNNSPKSYIKSTKSESKDFPSSSKNGDSFHRQAPKSRKNSPKCDTKSPKSRSKDLSSSSESGNVIPKQPPKRQPPKSRMNSPISDTKSPKSGSERRRRSQNKN